MSFDIEKNEYLCPLCESLCNTALPLLPTVTSNLPKNEAPISQEVHLCPDFWLRALEHVIKERVRVLRNMLILYSYFVGSVDLIFGERPRINL